MGLLLPFLSFFPLSQCRHYGEAIWTTRLRVPTARWGMQATKTIRVGAGQAGIWEQCEQNRRFNKKSVTPIIGTATPDRVQGALMPHLLRTITGRASCFLLATSSTPREPVLRDQMSSGTHIGLQVHHPLRSHLVFKGEKLESYSACRDCTAHRL